MFLPLINYARQILFWNFRNNEFSSLVWRFYLTNTMPKIVFEIRRKLIFQLVNRQMFETQRLKSYFCLMFKTVFPLNARYSENPFHRLEIKDASSTKFRECSMFEIQKFRLIKCSVFEKTSKLKFKNCSA